MPAATSAATMSQYARLNPTPGGSGRSGRGRPISRPAAARMPITLTGVASDAGSSCALAMM